MKNKNILVFDRDADICRVIAQTLELCGFRVSWCQDKATFIARLKASPADLIGADVWMSEVDAAQLIELVGQMCIRAPKILFLSAFAENSKFQGLGIEGAPVLRKPFCFNEFLALVESLGATKPT